MPLSISHVEAQKKFHTRRYRFSFQGEESSVVTTTTKMVTESRVKKPLVITDKDGNVIDLGGEQSAARETDNENDNEFRDAN